MATTYQNAYSQIRSNSDLAHKFVNDPHGTLASLGVDTSKMRSAAPANAAQATICAGCGVCVG